MNTARYSMNTPQYSRNLHGIPNVIRGIEYSSVESSLALAVLKPIVAHRTVHTMTTRPLPSKIFGRGRGSGEYMKFLL